MIYVSELSDDPGNDSNNRSQLSRPSCTSAVSQAFNSVLPNTSMSTTETARVNPDRVRKMLKAERRRRGEDSNYYGPDTPIYHVAQRFKITCAEVRKIARGRLHDQETPEG